MPIENKMHVFRCFRKVVIRRNERCGELSSMVGADT